MKKIIFCFLLFSKSLFSQTEIYDYEYFDLCDAGVTNFTRVVIHSVAAYGWDSLQIVRQIRATPTGWTNYAPTGPVTMGWCTSGGGGGCCETASNVGTNGYGVYEGQTGLNFEFRNIAPGSGKIIVTLDTTLNDINIDVNIDSLVGIAIDQIDSLRYYLGLSQNKLLWQYEGINVGVKGQWDTINVNDDYLTLSGSGGKLNLSHKESIVSLNGLDTMHQNMVVTENGSNFTITSSGNTHEFNLPIADVSTTGKLAYYDWYNFYLKVDTSRKILTTSPLTGGGNFSIDRTHTLANGTWGDINASSNWANLKVMGFGGRVIDTTGLADGKIWKYNSGKWQLRNDSVGAQQYYHTIRYGNLTDYPQQPKLNFNDNTEINPIVSNDAPAFLQTSVEFQLQPYSIQSNKIDTAAVRFLNISKMDTGLVGSIGANDTLRRIKIGSGLTLTNDTLKATGSGGITSLNGLTASTQTFALDTANNDVTITSTSSTHTFSFPNAGTTKRGLVNTGAQRFGGIKTFANEVRLLDTNNYISYMPLTGLFKTTTKAYDSGIGNFSKDTLYISEYCDFDTDASVFTLHPPRTSFGRDFNISVIGDQPAVDDNYAYLFSGANLTNGIEINTLAAAPIVFKTQSIERLRITSGGKVGIGQAAPSAYLHLVAGAAGANNAPLKFTQGTNLTIPEKGAIEYNGLRWFGTDSTNTRKTFAWTSELGLSNGDHVDIDVKSQGDTLLIDTSAVTNITIAANAVDSSKVAANSLVTADLKDSLITREKILNTDLWFEKKFEYFCDFTDVFGSSGLNGLMHVTVSGTGANHGSVTTLTNGTVGEAELTTGTAAIGRATLNSRQPGFYFGYGEWRFLCPHYISALSDATNRYQTISGFYDTETSVNQADGAYFLYDEGGVSTGSSASANFQCVTVNNSTRTFTNSGVAVSSAAYQKLEIVVNAAGTEVKFYINGSLVATHTTNIPTTAARATGFGTGIWKSAGTTARLLRQDYMYVRSNLTTAR